MSRPPLPALVAVLVLMAWLVGVGFLAAGATEAPRDEDLPATLDQVVTGWHDRAWVPGVAVSVREGSFAWSAAAGYADEQARTPLQADMPFYIASVTKPFVAAAVLRLVEDGLLALDDPLAGYVPEFPRATEVTIRQLLAMRSGIPDYTQAQGFTSGLEEDLWEGRTRRWTAAELLEVAAGAEPEFAPGARFAYSNTNYILLGEVIRVVTGQPWHEAVSELVLEPLALEDTLLPGGEQPGPIAIGHTDLNRDANRDSLAGRPYTSVVTAADAAGGLLSTADDLTAFARGLFRGELLSDEALAEMIDVERVGYEREYGLGVFVRQPDLRTTVIGHTGGGIGYSSVLWYAPEHDLAIAVLVNDSAAEPEDLAELLLRAVTTR